MKKIYSLILLFSCIQTAVHAQWAAVNNGVDNYVWGSAVYNNELYVSGNFENADGNQALGIAKWNGSAWSAVGGGFQTNAFSYVVRGLIVYNNELIAGGYVDLQAGWLFIRWPDGMAAAGVQWAQIVQSVQSTALPFITGNYMPVDKPVEL